ncbi:hypothetical protein GQ457_01G037840 [Hibiscus cannabinus]
MSSGEYRRSPRIIELDARKALARGQNKGNEVMDKEEPEKGQDILKQKRRKKKKKVKVRTVQDLIVNSVEYKVQKLLRLLELQYLKKASLNYYLVYCRGKTHIKYLQSQPMDFGTVAEKLSEGSYQTLEKFEACALKELATKLLLALKTDPENFETEASVLTMGHGRRKKTGVGMLNCKNKSNTSSIAARLNDVDVGRRRTYRPWKSSLSENESVVSAVYNSPMQFQLFGDFCRIMNGTVVGSLIADTLLLFQLLLLKEAEKNLF